MQQPKIKYLKDYLPPVYQVEYLNLIFDIQQELVTVIATAKYIKDSTSSNTKNSLELNGSANLVQIKLNNQIITEYSLDNQLLILDNLPDEFILEITTTVDAINNKSCMGLYSSNGNLFTQNEPEGFRKITFYQDRSDVMTKFTTTIIANKDAYPILLSNGNMISSENLSDNRHKVVWQDPFKKPSYLFALVAGKFALIQDKFITKSGQEVLLEVYSEKNTIEQCTHAMESLKKAMTWDEQRFNLEYDLQRYMIVASNDFNMGAMENKGLNIFNTKYVLADSKLATDNDFINVEAVVGHEYFHNWTGNRITCRDWFQLSLKEGLTVFRDQEFTADLHSRSVKRIKDVQVLRQNQFAEDASPLAHPVRPDSFIEINNFYTVTIYEKGAEVVRMYQTLLGKHGFNQGLKLYIERHDGQAVTCEDFCQAMADANKVDLTQFMLWYHQSGTPQLIINDSYDEDRKIYTLFIQQKLNSHGTQQPMLIPIEFGLLDNEGNQQPINVIEGNVITPDNNSILINDKEHSVFKFKVLNKPIPSLLRQFSAPVIINYPYNDEQIYILAKYDTDSFNRWESLQYIYQTEIIALYNNFNHKINIQLINCIHDLLNNTNLDHSMLNMLISLPSYHEVIAKHKPLNPQQLVNAVLNLKNQLADNLASLWLKIYQDNQTTEYQLDDAGKRSLKNTALNYLLHTSNNNIYQDIVELQFMQCNNMTDKIGALQAINDSNLNEIRTNLFNEFYYEYSEYPLAMDKWFALQAQSLRNDTLEIVINLTKDKQFNPTNPNKIYALIRSFANNLKLFNTNDGYNFISQEIIRIDKFNPSVAGGIATAFSVISSLDGSYQKLAKNYLENILATENLSQDVHEIISKINQELSNTN